MHQHLGLIYALSAYLWWGIIPIFWKQLDHVPSIEIVAHRMVWACAFVVLLIVISRQWKEFRTLLFHWPSLWRLTIASILVTTNWAIFIWAVNNENIVETSLGYFINPLISVFFGMLFFGERFRKVQILALVVAGLGVAVMVAATGGLPIISLSLAITFALYSVMKKKVSMPASHGLAIEMLVTLIPAGIYLFFLQSSGEASFGMDLYTNTLLVLGGLFTLVPLLLFAAAAKRVSMTTLGMTQYVGPTCQLLIGVMMYGEPFGGVTLLAFGFIWVALIIYTSDQLTQQTKRRRERRRKEKAQA